MTEPSNTNDASAGVLMAGSSDVQANINTTCTAANTAVLADVKGKPETMQQGSAPSLRETNKVLLERLARQVEYYFSTANLEKDTYVATLRSLNDGYVPLSIIANFGKVKALVPTDAVNSVRRAAIDYSELLEVVHIDTETGKRVDDETVATSPEVLTVEAVGPKSGEPIPMSSITSSTPISPSSIKTVTSNTQVQNTLIIREVPEGVEESHIRELFRFEKCPHIQSMHLDVANCWFVTMDTTSKDDMIHVMFELRSKKFPSGESVKARLKSAVVLTSDFSPSNIRFTRTDAPMVFAPQIQGGNKKMGQGNTGKKRKNNTKNKNSSNNNAAPQNKTAKGGKNGGAASGGQRRNNNNNPANGQKQNNRKQGSKQDDRSKAPQQAPPSLGEDHFPSLCNDDIMNKNKIEVEKLPDHRPEDEMDKARTSSDSASTATTTSSSSSSKNPQSSQQLVGGYAAALLKAAPPVPPKPVAEQKEESSPRQVPVVEKKDGKKSNDQKTTGPSKEETSLVRKDGGKRNMNKKATTESKANTAASVTVQPPSWGGGRSFADVLRKEGAAALEAATQRSS